MARVLVAASPGIVSVKWAQRVLSASLPTKDVEMRQFGKNDFLSGILRDLGCAFSMVKASTKPTRSELRSALGDVDHLLMLWDGRTLNELLFEARLRGTPTKVIPIEVAEVVNRDRNDTFDVYIGRGTPWGNPFPVGKLDGQYEREEAISLYQQHFEKNILTDPGLRRGLLGLRGLRLACHCKPLACHGDVIAGYLNNLDPDALE